MGIIEKQGGNGKVRINTDTGTATKTLKNGRSRESIARYKIEMRALEEIRRLNLPNIVEILSLEENSMEIVMRAYDGELSDVFVETKNNPMLCCKLLLPIIRSLMQLSRLPTPIYHRDLKPGNILYKRKNETIDLFISDFGCCYFEQDKDRPTPTFRAVGAQSYRAPEYDYGRVEEVTTKGDIYSLGKILWAMLNGVKGEIFPYTLWFPKEYNLQNRFPDSPGIVYLNLVIAKCVSINPDDRPTYEELIKQLEGVSETIDTADIEKQMRVKAFSARREVELQEIREMNASMLRLFYEDFHSTVKRILLRYSDFALASHLNTEYEKTYTSKDHQIAHKIKNDVASYIFSTSYDNFYLAIDYHPTYSKKDGTDDDKYARITLRYRISSIDAQNSLDVEYCNETLTSIYKGNRAQYTSQVLVDFMEDLIELYIDAFT